MKNCEKNLLRHLVKEEINDGHDMKTAVANIMECDGSNFTPQTIRKYYKAFSEGTWNLKDGRTGCTWGARHNFRVKNWFPKEKCLRCGAPAPKRILKEIEKLKAQGEID